MNAKGQTPYQNAKTGRVIVINDTAMFNSLQLKIQTLQILNDSLSNKLQLMLEYYELSCPALEQIQIVTRELKFPRRTKTWIEYTDKNAFIGAVRRYQKRYSNN